MSTRHSTRKRTPTDVYNAPAAEPAAKKAGQKRGRSKSRSTTKSESEKSSSVTPSPKRSKQKSSSKSKKSSSSKKKKSSSSKKKTSSSSRSKSAKKAATTRGRGAGSRVDHPNPAISNIPDDADASEGEHHSVSHGIVEALFHSSRCSCAALSLISLWLTDACLQAQHNPAVERKRMSNYSDKRKRQADHIEESYEKKGMGSKK